MLTFQFQEGDDAEVKAWMAARSRMAALSPPRSSDDQSNPTTSLTSTSTGSSLVNDAHIMPMPSSQHLPTNGKEAIQSSDSVRISVAYDQDQHDGDNHPLAQLIYLPGQDLQMKVIFIRRNSFHFVLYVIGSVLTVGILALIASYWAPQLERRWCYEAVPPPTQEELQQDKQVQCIVKIPNEPATIETLDRRVFQSPVAGSVIFPSTLKVPATSPTSTDRTTLIADNQSSCAAVHVLDYRHTPFLYHATSRKLISLADWLDSGLSTREPAPLASSEVDWRRKLFGENIIDAKGPSVLSLFLREALNPFYIFTFAACGLWGYDDYVVYAIIIGAISVLAIVLTVVMAKLSQIKLQKMSRYELDVPILRSDDTSSAGPAWQTRSSKDLVPGDIVSVQDFANQALPADLILLEGSCIANEAMLTGESVPSGKVAADLAALRSYMDGKRTLKDMEKSILWGGTNLLRVQADSSGGEVKAMCLSTGWASSKGSLVKMMLFPKPIKFDFYSDAFKFLAVLGTIAILGFIGSCANFIHQGVAGGEIALKLIDLATIALPPALPAILAMCSNFATARLKNKSIFCISPKRITVAGKVSLLVSDKTGTLTETGLDVQGVRYPCIAYDGRMSPLVQSVEGVKDATTQVDLECAMAVTHDVNLIEGEALGDPLEVSMLAWTGAKLEQDLCSLQVSTKDSTQIKVQSVSLRSCEEGIVILRKFDFAASLRRMSVLVQFAGSDKTTIFVKGAPESIIPLCDPASVPEDFELALNDATRKGLRVLAFGYKQVSLSWEGTRNATRDFAESQLNFLGLLFFENKLKVTTSAVLAELHEAGIPSKMCTGDSVLTAISVARSCGMIPSGQPVFVPRLPDQSKIEKSSSDSSRPGELRWTDVDLPLDSDKGNGSTLDPLTLSPTDSTLSLSQVGLAITGDVFTWLLAHASPETLARLLVQASVFARFSPEAKAELVSRLQDIGHCVLYCGDGSNDCGALQIADVGLSLSEAEASVAAPFTSASVDIQCVVDLIKEGRNCLAVSSSLFLYVACYALLEYFGVILLYGVVTSFANASYLYQDVFLLFAISIGASYSKPAKVLSRSRPPSRLMSRRVLLAFFGAAVILMIAELVPYLILHEQSWYVRTTLDDENLELNGQDSTTVAKTCFFGYTTLALIWNLGPPHRAPLYRNWVLSFALVALIAMNLAILWSNDDNNGLQIVFGFLPISVGMRGAILATAVVQFLLTSLWQFLLLERISKSLDGPLASFRSWRLQRAHRRRVAKERQEARRLGKGEAFVEPVLEASVSTEKTYRRVERALKFEEEQRKAMNEKR